MTRLELEHAVESMVDENTADALLDALQTVAFAKAQHVRESYNDSFLAGQWHKLALSLYDLPDFGV